MNIILLFLVVPLSVSLAWASDAQVQPPRPRVLNLDHVAVKSTDMSASVAFYCNFLGFAELGRKNLKGDSDRLQFVYLKINEDQRFEIFNGALLNPKEDRLYQIALHVEDATAVRVWLVEHGFGNAKGSVARGQSAYFVVNDPHGYHIEVIEHLPEGRALQRQVKLRPEMRVVECLVSARAAADDGVAALRFYQEVLGFPELSRVPAANGQPERIRLQMQASTDTVELVLAGQTTPHFTLAVADAVKAKDRLEHSAYYPTYGKPVDIVIGDDHRRRINLLDPMGIEVELVEIPAAP